MKKLMIVAAFAVFGLSNVNAQEETPNYGFTESDLFIEGSIMFKSTKDAYDNKSNEYQVSPKLGYFLSDDFAVGVDLSIGGVKDTYTAIGGGVFGRYYFLDLGKRFKTYSELGVAFGSFKPEGDSSTTAIGAGLGLGMNYFVTEKIALTFAVTDILSFTSVKDGDSEFNFGIGNVNNPFGGNAQFGLLFKL